MEGTSLRSYSIAAEIGVDLRRVGIHRCPGLEGAVVVRHCEDRIDDLARQVAGNGNRVKAKKIQAISKSMKIQMIQISIG
jgi:hypothetical protein